MITPTPYSIINEEERKIEQKVDLKEYSFFYRYCLVLKDTNKKLNTFLYDELISNDFNVQVIDNEEKKEKLYILSQTSEKRILLEAQIRKMRKRNSDLNEKVESIPIEVYDEEKKKAFSYLSKNKYIAEKSYYDFYSIVDKNLLNNPTSRWGLGLFTESEMLYLEKGILTEIKISDNDKFLSLFEKEKHDEIRNVLNHENRLFHIFELLSIFVDTFPIHTSLFKDKFSHSSLSKIEKFDADLYRNYYGDYVTLYFYWLDTYTSK